ncbi:MAG: FAD-dependent oxidoreductase [Dermatophilaceae bacterium]
MDTTPPRPTAVVVGAGISGLTAAHVLNRTHEVVLVEARTRLGGHAHTHEIDTPAGRLGIDSGFIVHNERTYPTFLRLLADLGIATVETEMSMSITCRECGLSYAGGRGLGGLLASPRRLADPRFARLLAEVPRFHRLARQALRGGLGEISWGEFLARGGFSAYFVGHFATPLVACVWSSGARDAAAYPAAHLFRFLDNHGMLSVTGSPTWRTIAGGSARYVEALAAGLPDVRSGLPVRAIERHDDGVSVRLRDGSCLAADRVVLATHADEAAGVLVDATPAEKSALTAIPYSRNEIVLHTDGSLLPTRARARASWNYSRATCAGEEPIVRVDYWMNKLHRLDADRDYVVTLNGETQVAPETILARATYHHPVFTRASVAAAASLRDLGGPRLAFAGAHLGWGFHEDGARSGLAAAERLGGRW